MAERTKLWIAAAMKRLMVKKPLDKIRVTEICREAEIERPTFYYHFQDKYDLVAWIFFQDADSTDILSVESAAAGMNRMRQEMLFYRRAYEDSLPERSLAVHAGVLCGSVYKAAKRKSWASNSWTPR